MSIAGAIDVPIEIVGGLVCDMAATELPPGVSPDCQDLIFAESSVRTRPGTGAPVATLAALGVVNYLKTFITSSGVLRTLAFDVGGTFLNPSFGLYKETSPLAFSLVQNLNDVSTSAPYMNSVTAFTREYLAVSDGIVGNGLPRQFDDTNLDRVSQVGPGAAPTVGDENLAPVTIFVTGLGPITANIVSLTEVGNVVTATVTPAAPVQQQIGDYIHISGAGVAGYNGDFQISAILSPGVFQYVNGSSGLAPAGAAGAVQWAIWQTITTTPHGLSSGGLATIAGASNAGFNGTWPIRSIDSPTKFTVAGGLAQDFLPSSGNGTVTGAGNITAGVRLVSVIFVTRTQYLTAPAPPSTWTALGLKRAVVTNIPIGPPNVVQRILIFTAAGGANFFYISGGVTQIAHSNMVINDNTTTSTIVDFTDAILLAGTNADNLFNQVELGECAGVIQYKTRLFWWEERAKLENMVNLTFDGGFSNPGSAPNFPLGWTPDATSSAGGGSVLAAGGPVVWGDAYAITGDGLTVVRGKIAQSAFQDFRGVPIIQAGVDYSVRARVLQTAGLKHGALHINLTSVIGGFTTAGIVVHSSILGGNTKYQEIIAELTAPLTTVPADLQLQIYADGTPTNAQSFLVDCVELFQTNQATNLSFLRASGAGNPESYDGTDGLIGPANDGIAIRNAFALRERLYLVKEFSMYATQDDATNEPSFWSVDQISPTVGTPSLRGVGLGEDWVVIAARAGLYIFSGGEPQKISQEIGHSDKNFTLAWDQINWAFGHTLWVTVDTLEKRIYIGAPFNGATSPNAVLMLDYRDLDGGAAGIAGNPPVIVSYQGKKIVKDKSRKWSPWTISANSCAMIERNDGTAHLWMGVGAFGARDPGGIYDVQASNLTDTSGLAQIPSYYTTAFVPQREQNQQTGTHEHRKLFSYLAMFVEGSGIINLTAIPNQFATWTQQGLPSLILNNPAWNDLETSIDVHGERVAFRISQSPMIDAITGKLGASWFRLQKFTPSMQGDPNAPVRGVN